MRTFLTIWLGQLGSLLGSGLTGFALGVWTYQQSGSATQYAMIPMSSQVASFLVTPLAGVLIDRWNRRTVMILADTGSVIGTLILLILLSQNHLSLWAIYLFSAVNGICHAFQAPAYTAAVTLLVPKEHYVRASGMVQVADGLSQIVSPVLAGFLMGYILLHGILVLDLTTFAIALFCLLIVRIPKTPPSTDPASNRGSIWKEATYGWKYLRERKGLLQLLSFFAISNFITNMIMVLTTPMVLSIASEKELGTLMAVCGLGMLFGSLATSAWGGPKSLVKGILNFSYLSGLAAFLVGFTPSLIAINVAGFCFFFFSPMIGGCSQALWQRKVAPDLQGRVFSARRMVAFSMLPLAYGLAGPLADYIFEPLMAVNGPLSQSIGSIMGTGPGRGIGLMYVVMAALFMVTIWCFSRMPNLRNLEQDLPDHTPDAHEQEKTEA